MELFNRDFIYIRKEKTKEEVFDFVATDLLKRGYVTKDFYGNLLERESTYPTGMDMKVIDEELPNIAIPHTESDYVNKTLVVPVKLVEKIEFKNMIKPEESLEVSYLFMILNDQKEEQSNILASIMDFWSSNDPAELKEFFKYDKPNDIYNFLVKNF